VAGGDKIPGPQGPGLLDATLRHWWLVVILAALGGLAGYGVSTVQPSVYTATARLLLTDSPTERSLFSSGGDTSPERRLLNEAQRISSGPVLERAADLVGGRLGPEEISDRLRISPSVDSDVIRISATDSGASEAAELVNSVATAYQETVEEVRTATAARAGEELETYQRELQVRIDDIDARLAELRGAAAAPARIRSGGFSSSPSWSANTPFPALLSARAALFDELVATQARARQVAADAVLNGSSVDVFEPASPPGRPTEPRPERNIALGAMLGLLAGAALAWRRAERQEPLVRSGDAAMILGAPQLGAVPAFKPADARAALARAAPGTRAAEAYRLVVSSLALPLEQRAVQTIVVTSPRFGEGKSATALNLAVAAARGGRRITLVDADLRSRRLTKLVGAEGRPGLADLRGAAGSPLELALDLPLGEGRSISVLPTGAPAEEAADLFGSAGWRMAARRLEQASDLVLVDAPPLLELSDGLELAAGAGALLLVISRDTSIEDLHEVAARLSYVDAPLLGFVYNDIKVAASARRRQRAA
jgi:polysaccharide biosynthesis transport protein